jgi:hypothetical protein
MTCLACGISPTLLVPDLLVPDLLVPDLLGLTALA